jgi:hypothetical protein
MAKKIELTKEQFEEIRKFYLFEKMTTKQISKKIKISETVICKNLKKNGLYINTNDIDKIEFKKGDLQKEIDRRKDLLTQKEFRVIGIASKLLSFFVKKYNPKSIISFADRRWTLDKCNNLYTNIGFELKNTLKPDYTYYNPKLDRFRRYHKFGFGKNSIKKKFPEIYSGEKTEWMMMQEAGYDRIWDCGKFCYELRFN